jgi:hypothetical protein
MNQQMDAFERRYDGDSVQQLLGRDCASKI